MQFNAIIDVQYTESICAINSRRTVAESAYTARARRTPHTVFYSIVVASTFRFYIRLPRAITSDLQ